MSSKKAYYFSHDANAHEDDKIIVLMSQHGAQGYGWWWLLVETLFNQEDNCLDMSKKTTVPLLYRILWDCDIEKIPEFIDSLVEIELLYKDGEKIYSKSLLQRVEKFDKIRESRRQAANVRWGKSKGKEDSLPFEVEESGLEVAGEVKGKAVLADDEQWELFKGELLAHKSYKIMLPNQLDDEREKALNWLASKGARKKDYKAFFRNWVKKFIEDRGLQNTGKMIY